MFTLAGAFVLGALRVAGIDFGSPWLAAYLVGLGCVVAGPLILWRGFLRLLSKERVLTIHQDGVRWQVSDDATTFCAWRELGAVTWSSDILTVPVGAGGDAWRLPLPFEGIDAPELARLLAELQQKALLGLPVRPRSSGS